MQIAITNAVPVESNKQMPKKKLITMSMLIAVKILFFIGLSLFLMNKLRLCN